ncbi:hypothetical protein QU481_17260 [Crenobacter sp. SG2303]|uniref:Flagellar FliJ protein n=1 Tax=Crenobacter oryzisoli TaxID=3056844 RepID=A0ABT7XS46_9NEIS|nr:hypothetical protein [Crenobacter sp. SG2303]MDN0076617.1 hypothetical protein [Crenobacter sp. SG2303]
MADKKIWGLGLLPLVAAQQAEQQVRAELQWAEQVIAEQGRTLALLQQELARGRDQHQAEQRGLGLQEQLEALQQQRVAKRQQAEVQQQGAAAAGQRRYTVTD